MFCSLSLFLSNADIKMPKYNLVSTFTVDTKYHISFSIYSLRTYTNPVSDMKDTSVLQDTA